MHTAWMVTALVLAQTTPAPGRAPQGWVPAPSQNVSPAPPAQLDDTPPAAPPSRSLAPVASPTSPQERWLREWFGPEAAPTAAETGATGRPLPLAELLRRVPAGRTRIQAVGEYWNLAAAVAESRAVAARRDTLGRLVASGRGDLSGDARAEAALASAEADQQSARLAVLQAQHTLADRLGQNEWFWPSDLPLVDPYQTRFDELFPGGEAPLPLVRIHRSLPLRHLAIVRRAAAADACDAALGEVAAAFQAGRAAVDDVLLRLDAWLAAQQQYLRDVRDYNRDIAAYSLAVAPATAPVEALAGMLIRTDQPGAVPQHQDAPQPPAEAEPSRLPAEATDSAPMVTPLPPVETPPRPAAPRLGVPPPRSLLPTTRDAPHGARRVEPQLAERFAGMDQSWYEALRDLPAPRRAQRLGEWLHQTTAAPADAVRLSLEACLAAAEQRPAAVRAYWQLCCEAACYEQLLRQSQRLAALESRLARPVAAVRAARLATDADGLRQQVALLTAQAELGQWVRPPAGKVWWPATVPHAGRYRLALPAGAAANRALPRRQAARIDEAFAALEGRSWAAVLAQRAEASAQQAFAGGGDEDAVLEAIAAWSEQTRQFLQEIFRYNTAIAQYVLAAHGQSPPEALVAAMVVPRATNP